MVELTLVEAFVVGPVALLRSCWKTFVCRSKKKIVEERLLCFRSFRYLGLAQSRGGAPVFIMSNDLQAFNI